MSPFRHFHSSVDKTYMLNIICTCTFLYQLVTISQSYTKSSFFGEYFNQPSPLYLPIKVIEFISEVNPSRNVLDSVPTSSYTSGLRLNW